MKIWGYGDLEIWRFGDKGYEIGDLKNFREFRGFRDFDGFKDI